MAESLSRVEAILENTLGHGTELPKPQSRVENLLVELKDAIGSGGVAVDTQMDPESPNPVSNSAIYDFVNSSVSTNTADFKGTYNSISDLQEVDADNNDYGFVVSTDADGNTVYNRYKFDGSSWAFEYALNNSSFTAAQWATIQSGLTAADKTKLNSVESGANKTVVDSSLSGSSTNPVENRAVYTAIENLQTGWAAFNAYQKPVVYGYRINADNSIDYLADAEGKTPAAMGTTTFSYGDWQDAFFMPKPCMLKSDTTVAYYLDPNDYSKKTDGTDSDIDDSSFDGNAMMEWGLIYSKFYQIGDDKYFLCSNVNVDGKFRCDNNTDARGRITPHFYTAIYNGTGTDKLRSISGVALTSANGNGNTNVTQEVTRATANNTGTNVEWYTSVWADERLIDALLILIGKSLDVQSTFGRGLDAGGQSSKEAYVTGSLNDKGLFWGDLSSGDHGVKVFGMENWWGCVWRRVAGLITVNGALRIKLTYGANDGSTTVGYNQTGSGYIANGTVPSSNGLVNDMRYDEYGFFPSSIITSEAASAYKDYYYQNATITSYLLVGGNSAAGSSCGFAFNVHNAASNAHWYVATALSCKPLA